MRATYSLGFLSVVLPLALAAFIQPAHAQFFPLKGTVDEIEQEADRLEKELQLKLQREAELQQRAKENADRWKAIQADLKKKLSGQLQEISKSEFKALYSELVKANAWFRVAEAYYYLGAWKQADLMLRQSFEKEQRTAWVDDGWSLVLLIRCQIGDFVVDETFDERFAKRLDSKIEDWKKVLDRSLAEKNQRSRNQRERNYNGFKAWMDKLPEYLAHREKIAAEIQADTWNADAMWRMAVVYRNELFFWGHARAWLELLKQYCPDSQQALDGQADLMIAEILARQGQFGAAQELVAATQNKVEQAAESIQQKLKDVTDKLKANPDYKLTPEELRLSKLLPEKMKEDIKGRCDNMKNQIENREKEVRGK